MASTGPLVLSELVKEPFGPFKDSDILNHTCKSIRTKPLTLSNVLLRGDGRIVGLDTTEPYQQEHRSYKTIKISGVLEIMELSWLSETGRRRLTNALHERDGHSTLTLERLYGTTTSKYNGKSGRTVKVTIIAEKNMTVGYLTSDQVPNGLRIDTVNCHRWFIIGSLREPTFQLSRQFLGRYRSLRVLRDILEYDQKSRRSNEPTPQADRAPVWFARHYIQRMREINSRNEASVHLSSDSSDADSDSEKEHRIAPYQIKSLRHRNKGEVLRMFRKHASWLISDQEKRVHKQKRLFEPNSWKRWLARGEDADDMFADEESDGDMDVDEEERLSLSAKARGKRKASDRSPEPDEEEDGRTGTRLRQRSPTPDDGNDCIVDTLFQRDYDPDFSPPSTPGWAPSSEASFPSRPPTPDSPTLRDRVKNISTLLWYEPDPPKSALWFCPVDKCYYHIDLLKLTKEQLSVLKDKEVVEKLCWKIKSWSCADDWVVQACKKMARAHYDEHLRSVRVRMWWDKWKRPHLAYANSDEEPHREQQEEVPVVNGVKREEA